MMFKVSITAYFCIILCLENMMFINALIGINWGRNTKVQMLPSVVVDLLLQNQVKAVKLSGNDDDIIGAFNGTNIEVSISLQNASGLIKNLSDAYRFVDLKIAPFINKVKFRYVVVQTISDYGGADNNDMKTIPSTTDALQFVQSALDNKGYGYIKTILPYTILGAITNYMTKPFLVNSMLKPFLVNSISKPSEASFTTLTETTKVLKILNKTGAPFMFNLFPYSFLTIKNIDLNFAFFDNSSTHIVRDVNGLVYRNVFEFVHDSYVWAMKKAGYENVKLVAGNIGWPSDGADSLNLQNAERFWSGMLSLAASNRGTPMRPGVPIEIYVHQFSDDNVIRWDLNVKRHYGIYRSNGEPKYKIDLSGQGRDIYPTSASGTNKLMPYRWCVFDKEKWDKEKVDEQFHIACSNGADCTNIFNGSCTVLSYNESISYAFNGYFQANYQDEKSCAFENLGMLTTVNPSRDGCLFTVEIVKNSKEPEKSIW